MSADRSGTAESPFRAKGLVFIGAREYIVAHVAGGLDAVRAHLQPNVATFFDQNFLTGGWYDAMQILPISIAAARAAGKPQPKLVRENAEWVAKRDLRGIYKLIVAMASIEAVAERLPDLSLRYLNFGRADGKMVGDKLFESHRHGIPAPLADWFVAATNGFVPVALGTAGATNVRIRVSPHAADGHAHGFTLVRTKFEISWD